MKFRSSSEVWVACLDASRCLILKKARWAAKPLGGSSAILVLMLRIEVGQPPDILRMKAIRQTFLLQNGYNNVRGRSEVPEEEKVY